MISKLRWVCIYGSKICFKKIDFFKHSGEILHVRSKSVGSKWVRFCESLFASCCLSSMSFGVCDLMPFEDFVIQCQL